jgi:hypothetical protein
MKKPLSNSIRSEVKKWSGAGLNRRHLDFQSSALPTELPDLNCITIKFPKEISIGRSKTMQPIIEKKFESESTQCFLANEFDRNTKVYSINTVFSCLHLVGNSVRV